jgi:hypothetical protein
VPKCAADAKRRCSTQKIRELFEISIWVSRETSRKSIFKKKLCSALFGRDTEIISTQYSRTIMSLLSFLTEFKPNWCQNEKPQFNLTSTTHNYHFSESTCDAVDLLINKAPKIDNSTWTLDLAYIKNLFENKDSNVDDWNGRQVQTSQRFSNLNLKF